MGRGQNKKLDRDPLFNDQTLVIGGKRVQPCRVTNTILYDFIHA